MITQVKKFKKIGSVLFLPLILIFFAYQIGQNWSSVSKVAWSFDVTDLLLIAFFALPLFLINVWGWHLVLVACGEKISFWKSVKIWMISNLGRFIPGGIWQYGGKVYLSKKEGISISNAVLVTFLEAFFVLLAGVLLSLLLYATSFLALPRNIVIFLSLCLLPAFCFLFLLTDKNKMKRLVASIFKLLKRRPPKNIPSIKSSQLPKLIGAYALQFIFAGGVLYSITQAAVSLDMSRMPAFVAIYALSWMAGYLTLIAPAGFGVQEASIAGFLTLFVPFHIGLVIALFFRLALLVSEFLTLLMVFLLTGVASKKKKSI